MEQHFDLENLRLYAFLEQLSSGDRVPGGGGAVALVGALAAALGRMSCNLAIGRPDYAESEESLTAILVKAGKYMYDLTELINEDAGALDPLIKAMGMPRNTDEEKAKRAEVMENALASASDVPLQIMEKTMLYMRTLPKLEKMVPLESKSDLAISAKLCRAAIEGASLNVYINTKMMKNRARAEALNEQADGLIAEEQQLLTEITGKIKSQFEKPLTKSQAIKAVTPPGKKTHSDTSDSQNTNKQGGGD